MITASIIFAIVYVLIALGKIPQAVLAVLGASLVVFLGVISGEDAFSHVDLNVILLLAAMMVLADIVARTGAFDYAAIAGARLVRGNGFLTLCLLSLITAFASAFLDNVTTVVLMAPIILALCRSLQIAPVPFLISQVFASNIGGTATIVGDPPNIIVASAGNIGFLDFMLNVAPVSILCMVVLVLLLVVWFRNSVTVTEERRRELLSLSPAESIRDKPLLQKSLAVFGLTIVGFLVHDLLGIEPAFIAIAGAGVLMLVSRLEPGEVLHSVEWSSLAFFTGLFILVGSLVETGATDVLQRWMVQVAGGNEVFLAQILVWFGGGVSAIVDNIPYAATMTPVVGSLVSESEGDGTSPLWWGLVLGADLGGNLTAIGASANVVVLGIARAQGHPIGFFQFMKYGAAITISTLLVASIYIWALYYL